MAHVMILGQTLSGKTTLAKRLVPIYQARGIKCGVLDPLGDPGWNADFRTSDVDEFLAMFWASERCAWFIDEAGEVVGQYDKLTHKTATRGRHHGHRVHYIAQGGTQLAPIVRNQCTRLFLFTTALEDCKTHANEWNKPELRNAYLLPQGHYYAVDRFNPLQRGQLW